MNIIAGKYKKRKIAVPKTGLRPTESVIREALWNIFDAQSIRLLDLYAGSGSIALEALSRGADYAVLVEQNPKAASVIKENIETFKAENAKLVVKRALSYVKGLNGREAFDIVFADPPYHNGEYEKLLNAVEKSGCLNEGAKLVMELHEKDKELDILLKRCGERAESRNYGSSTLLIINF